MVKIKCKKYLLLLVVFLLSVSVYTLLKDISTPKQVSFPDLMLRRKNRVSSLCNDNDTRASLYQPIWKNLISFPLKSLPMNPSRLSWILWCPVYKAASSSWFYRMSKLLGATSKQLLGHMDELGHKMTNSRSRSMDWVEEQMADNSNTVSFVVVRNPLDRLVSAYRNKYECVVKKKGSLWFYKIHGIPMVKQYRTKGLEIFGQENYRKTFSSHRACKSENEPTFWEFVQYVLQHPTLDNHWKPFSQICGVCKMHYSYILQFESLATEETQFLAASNLSAIFPPKHLNRETKAGEESPTINYLRMLRWTDWQELVKMYRHDIETGGYQESVEMFREIVFKNEETDDAKNR